MVDALRESLPYAIPAARAEAPEALEAALEWLASTGAGVRVEVYADGVCGVVITTPYYTVTGGLAPGVRTALTAAIAARAVAEAALAAEAGG